MKRLLFILLLVAPGVSAQPFDGLSEAITEGDYGNLTAVVISRHGEVIYEQYFRGATANAERAGVDAWCSFTRGAVADLQRPDGPPGLVMINPPYGARIGNKKPLFALHNALGQVLKERFKGWRVGIITSDGGLAKATGLPFLPTGAPVAHGGLKVKLYRTEAL